MDIHRAPITETVIRNGPPASDGCVSQRGRRNGTGATFHRRAQTLNRSNSRNDGILFPDDEEGNFSDQSRMSDNSFRSPNEEWRPQRSRDQSRLPKFSTRREIRPPRAATSREVDYVKTKKRGDRDFWEI